MDQVNTFIEPGRNFAKDSIRLIKRCTKPDKRGEYYYLSLA